MNAHRRRIFLCFCSYQIPSIQSGLTVQVFDWYSMPRGRIHFPGRRRRPAPPPAPPDPEPPEAPVRHSHLIDRIVQLWCWGILSATVVQFIVEGAILYGLENELARAVSEIGSSGLWPSNCHRDLVNNFIKRDAILQPDTINVHMHDPKRPSRPYRFQPLSILWPHQLVSVLSTVDSWFAPLLGDGLESLWGEMMRRGDPSLHNNPIIRERPDWMRRAVPIVIYGMEQYLPDGTVSRSCVGRGFWLRAIPVARNTSWLCL